MDDVAKIQKCFRVAQEITIDALMAQKELSREDALSVVDEDLEHIRTSRQRYGTLDDIYRRLVFSLQNRGMMPNVIGDVNRLGPVLCEFSPGAVREKYDHDDRRLFEDMSRVSEESGKKVRTGKGSMWRLFASGCLDAAHYLEKFSSRDDFYSYVEKWCQDADIVSAFPLFLSQQNIKGLGPALAADFLMEIGVTALAKPDVHTRRALAFAGLIPPGKVPDLAVIRVFHSASRAMGPADFPPVILDRILWQLGSGKFGRYSWKNPLRDHDGRMEQFRREVSLP
jgi:hypothetical protein